MDMARKIGTGIVMIVPTFVGGGAVWDIFHSWFAVLVWVVVMGWLTGSVMRGKFVGRLASGSSDH